MLKSKLRYIALLFRASLKPIQIINNRDKETILFFRKDNSCIELDDGIVRCYLFDSFIKRLLEFDGYRFDILTAMPLFSKNLSCVYGDSLDLDAIFARFRLFRFIFLPVTLAYRHIFRSRFVTRGSSDFFCLFEFLAWIVILHKVEPKVVIAFQPGRSLCRAGHFKGVKVVEFQHGVISSQHAWYSYDTNIGIGKEYLPHGFYLWDNESFRVIERWTEKKRIICFVVGRPVQQNDEDEPPLRQGFKRKNVLISLQWGLEREGIISDPEYLKYGLIPPLLINFIKSKLDDVNWNIRLHPVQMNQSKLLVESRLEEFFGNNSSVFWRHPSQAPLEELLTETDLHMTFSSSVLKESALYGVYSIAYDYELLPGGSRDKYFEDIRTGGRAIFINLNNYEEQGLYELIRNSIGFKKPKLFKNVKVKNVPAFKVFVDFIAVLD
jgi:hypothetical protein